MKRIFYGMCISLCILFAGCSNDVIKNEEIKDTGIKTTESKKAEPKTTEIHETVTPLLIKNYFIGGVIGGKLYNAEEFYNKNVVIMKNFEYDVYKSGGKLGTFIGSDPMDPRTGDSLKEPPYNSDYVYIELYDKDRQTVDFDIALEANWELFPRGYQRQDTNQSVYKEIVDKVLMKEGIENPVSHIKEIIRVDLDGDGTQEVVLTANDTTDNMFHDRKKGANAIVLFRKIVDGKVHQDIVVQDLWLEEPEEATLYRYLFEVCEIADLDGDGIMEVIIKGWYYEGEEYCVYKLIDHKLELVAVNGFGA